MADAVMTLAPTSPPDQVAEAIVRETIKRRWPRKWAIAVLSTGLQESGLRMVWSPNRKWYGYFQQDASYPGRTDPNLNILGFIDRLEAKINSPGASDDIWKNIFWLQQRPGEASADYAYNDPAARRAYLTEIKQHTSRAEKLYDTYSGGVITVPDNRPDFNEYWNATTNHSSRGSTKVDAFFLHTQDGGGGDDAADNLSKFIRSTESLPPKKRVSYHYAIGQASDGGVTVVDCVDTDYAAWSVLSANTRSINLCFAGSRAAWTRDQWLKQAKAIDVAAYLAVQDAKKYGFPATVIAPPYLGRIPGISDHRYVTKVLGDGTHTDVGDEFPWDVFSSAVAKYTSSSTPAPVPPPGPVVKRFPEDWSDRELMIEVLRQLRGPDLDGWPQLDNRSLVDFVAELRSERQ